MTDKKALIDDILGAKEAPIDRSLRGKALHRATSAAVPRTLTAWEWEEYYNTHGVPDAHIKTTSVPSAGLLSRLRTWLTQ